MALRYIDSMGDHYTAAQVNLKWTTSLLPVRRTGVHGFAMAGMLKKGMLFGSTTIIMEAYIQRLTSGLLFSFDDRTTPNPITQIHCDVISDGTLYVSRYGSSSGADLIAQTPPDTVRANTWYHLGWKVLLHPSAGSIEVRLNGATILSASGIKTVATSLPWSGEVGSFTVGDNGSGVNFDDLVVMDDVDDGISDSRLPGGGGFDKFLGPVEIIVKRPDGVGTVTGWTPAPAGSNWDNVNDIESDDDTTLNSASPAATGASDLFTMEDLTTLQDVVGVQSLVLARKTEEGVAAIAKQVRDTGTTTTGSPFYLPSTYSYLITPEPTLPGGGLWSRTRWNAIEYGYTRMV